MLGAAGATVYCTGRSVKGHPATPARPETIEETAAMVTAEGGRGIAVRTDHTVESEVELLFQRVRAEQGRLDVLVNDIWGGDALTEWGAPFWELSTAKGLEMLEHAVHSHLITSRHGAPLMIERNAGLIVEVTDGDTLGYRGNLFYDLAKNAVIRLAYAMAADLHAHRVTALAITPGFLCSEAVLDAFSVSEANWRAGIKSFTTVHGAFPNDSVRRPAIHQGPYRTLDNGFSEWQSSDIGALFFLYIEEGSGNDIIGRRGCAQ